MEDRQGIITLQLRAERSGSGNGRVYAGTITGTDTSGNKSQAKVEIRVPRARGKSRGSPRREGVESYKLMDVPFSLNLPGKFPPDAKYYASALVRIIIYSRDEQNAWRSEKKS